MTRGLIAFGVVALSLAAVPVYAQSLGELARAEEARRAAAPKTTKTYSNVSLPNNGVPDPAPAEAPKVEKCDDSKKDSKCVPGDVVAEKSAPPVAAEPAAPEAPSEAAIRKQADEIRADLAEVQSYINQLVSEAADGSKPDSARRAAENRLNAMRPSLASGQRRWAELEKKVSDFKLPHAWIEPVPANAK